MKTNYHTHCSFCDGDSAPEDMVRAALDKGFDILGFSSHAPLAGEEDWTLSEEDVPEYIRQITDLKEQYRDRLAVLIGLERDYVPGRPVWPVNRWGDFQLDFTIGSVHMMPGETPETPYAIDGPVDDVRHLVENVYKGDVRKMAGDFYGITADMVRRETFDFLGHLDVLRKRNLAYPFLKEEEPWYLKTVCDLLDVIAREGVLIEINTGGISRGATETVYPSAPILRECRKRDIPVVINSDAHSPKDLDAHFELARQAALDAGYREESVMMDGAWSSIKL